MPTLILESRSVPMMNRPRRFIPCLHDDAAGHPPPSDPRTRQDFIRQHIVRGWPEADAHARYEQWRRGEIEADPVIPLRRR
jgi:hypothetical protein